MAPRFLQSGVLFVGAALAAASESGARGGGPLPRQPVAGSSSSDHRGGGGSSGGGSEAASLGQAAVRQTSALATQTARAGAAAAARRGAVECVPGETLTASDLHTDVLASSGLCHLRGVSTSASVIVTGGATLIMEGGEVEGAVKVEGSPGSNVFLHGVEVGGISFSNSGSLEISNGSTVGPVEVLSSGDVLISNSKVFGVDMSDSGDVTITEGSDVGGVETKGSGSVIVSGGTQIESVVAEMCKSVKLSGGVSVEMEVEALFVQGTVELDNVTLGGAFSLDKSPGAHVRISASKVPELMLTIAGDLDVAPSSELGPVDIKGSGHVRLAGSAMSEVMMSDSGNLTISAGTTISELDLDRSGHLTITKDVAIRGGIMCKSSGEIVISDNVAVETSIEVFNVQGGMHVSDSTVGGPLNVVSASGDVVVDASAVRAWGLTVEKCSGSVGLRASSFPSFQVKGVSGDIFFVDMQAKDLNLEGVEGEVIFSGVKTSGSSMFNNIVGGVVCPSAQPAAPAKAALQMHPARSWAAWLEGLLWPAA